LECHSEPITEGNASIQCSSLEIFGSYFVVIVTHTRASMEGPGSCFQCRVQQLENSGFTSHHGLPAELDEMIILSLK
jgi:hypothetical protein